MTENTRFDGYRPATAEELRTIEPGTQVWAWSTGSMRLVTITKPAGPRGRKATIAFTQKNGTERSKLSDEIILPGPDALPVPLWCRTHRNLVTLVAGDQDVARWNLTNIWTEPDADGRRHYDFDANNAAFVANRDKAVAAYRAQVER
jgi:hypothetical protein